MGLLNKDQILTADDLPTKDIDVPAWGGTVRLRGLTGTERDAFEASMIAARNGKLETNLQNVRSGLVAKCIVDEDGQRLFTDTDVKRLGMKSAQALDRLFTEAQKLSGLGDDDVEAMAGNSEETDGEASPSVSQNISVTPAGSSSTDSALVS